MSERALELRMSTSTFGHPAGGWFCEIQDTYSLQGGNTFEEPTLIDLVKVPTTDSIADFFTVTQVGDALELEIWRSGQE